MDKELYQMQNKLQSISNCYIKKVPLYRGIELYFFTAKTNTFSMQHSELNYIMEINYCRTGRLGWKMGNGNQIYLGPGNFSLHTLDFCADSTICFPTENYEGLTLCVDFHELAENPPELLENTGICQEIFNDKFLKNSIFASFAGNTQTDAIFSSFYEQQENLKLSYQKIKSIELLLYLSKMELDQSNCLTEYQSEQVEVVRKVHDHLTENIGQRITIEALARQYLINPTTLKTVFKSVYGNSLAAHIKEHRMELAARLLRETDLNMAQISEKVGYESQSKFTAAFKAYYQILPKEYRKK